MSSGGVAILGISSSFSMMTALSIAAVLAYYFFVIRRRNKYYETLDPMLIHANDDYCLNLKYDHRKNGNPIHLWQCKRDHKNATWLYDEKTKQLKIKNAPHKCIILGKKDPRDKTVRHLVLGDCENAFGNPTEDSKWEHNIKTGQIKSLDSDNNCLTIAKGDIKNGKKVLSWLCYEPNSKYLKSQKFFSSF